MMPPSLEDIVAVLQGNGFTAAVERVNFAGADQVVPSASAEIVLGEQPLLVVAVLKATKWSEVADHIEEWVVAVADLVAERDPSARQWDLTILLLLDRALGPDEVPAAAAWTSSTSYARRVVADRLGERALEEALAPILPIGLQQPAKAEKSLFDRLRIQLALDLGDDAANLAVASFENTGEVQIS